MPIVNTSVPITAESCNAAIAALVQAYPFCRSELLVTTAFQRPIRTLVIGNGPRKVIYSASHHANEWITSLVLLKFAEALAEAIQSGQTLGGQDARQLAQTATIYMVPMVNPDGVDLVTGALQPGDSQYESARQLGERYPQVPFPFGWKANLLGVDLNLNYPAQWEKAREIKFSQGYTQPGPRDYVGSAPLDQQETKALAELTRKLEPSLVLAYHSQGEVIYWQFADIEIPGARVLAERFSRISGYALEDTPYASSFAGYKDWFIQDFRRPGFTIEVGKGKNPLPLEQFPGIFEDNLGILSMVSG